MGLFYPWDSRRIVKEWMSKQRSRTPRILFEWFSDDVDAEVDRQRIQLRKTEVNGVNWIQFWQEKRRNSYTIYIQIRTVDSSDSSHAFSSESIPDIPQKERKEDGRQGRQGAIWVREGRRSIPLENRPMERPFDLPPPSKKRWDKIDVGSGIINKRLIMINSN